MKKILAGVLVSLIVLSLFTVSVCAAGQNLLPSGVADADIADVIDGFLNDHADNHAAVATAVFRGDEDLYVRYFGYTDADGTVPLDENSVLEWGSVSKLTVWVSAIQLVCKGKLDLSADIRGYLPDGFLKNLRFDKPVTMLDLMNHSAGFQETDFILEVTNEADIIPLGEYLSIYQPLQVFEPGTVVAYSNWGAALAGYIVECIADMPFYRYVGENVFTPLEMTRSAIKPDLGDNAYVKVKRGEFVSYLPDGEPAEDETKVFILPYPAGMCTSTLGDFAAFAKALLTRDERLLPSEGFDLLFSPSLYFTGTDTARLRHGFLVDHDFAVAVTGHDGNTSGGSSRLLLDLENGVGMVMLTNQLGGSVYRTAMAEKVFGKSEYHIPVDGYYIPARNIFAGKQKIMSNLFLIDHCHITQKMVDGLYINVLPDRFEISSCDYLVPTENYALRDAFTVIWFVLSAAALVFFLIRAVLTVINAVKKRAFDMYNALSGLYALLVGLSALTAMPGISASAALAYLILLCLLGAAFTVYLAVKRKKIVCSKLSAFGYAQSFSLILFLAVAAANMIIWDIAVII